jgi:hypothetical protein
MYNFCPKHFSLKKKVKGASRGFFNTPTSWVYCILAPNKFPHSSSEAPRIIQMRETSTSEGGNYSPKFASGTEFYKNSLGFFTCRKAGTWDMLFYFPTEGRHTEDFLDVRKIQRLRPGFNPRTRVPVASMLTTRPPKPSKRTLTETS